MTERKKREGSRSDKPLVVELDCGHKPVFFPPHPPPGSVITCAHCDKGAVVRRAGGPDLSVRCRPCRFARPVPSNEMFEARAMARRHYGSSKHRERSGEDGIPTVGIFDHGRQVDAWGATPSADPPPF